jgi:hypothetical protein
MKQQKWKYAKPKKNTNFEEYLQLPENKKVKVLIKNWNFSEENVDGDNRTVIRTDAIEVDGQPRDQRLVIKQYDAVQAIKKHVSRKKSAKDTALIEITRKYDSDSMDYVYDINFL